MAISLDLDEYISVVRTAVKKKPVTKIAATKSFDRAISSIHTQVLFALRSDVRTFLRMFNCNRCSMGKGRMMISTSSPRLEPTSRVSVAEFQNTDLDICMYLQDLGPCQPTKHQLSVFEQLTKVCIELMYTSSR